MKYLVFALVGLSLLFGGWLLVQHRQANTKPVVTSTAIKYLPLGDSYTIGEGVKESDRWPNQLQAYLRTQGIETTIVANPARTGYTTLDLLEQELPVLQATKPGFVTIQIGVNDWVRATDVETFQQRFRRVLDEVQAMMPDKSKLLLVTIPDFGKTPTGAQIASPNMIEIGLRDYNKVITDEAARRQIPVADIFSISQAAATDTSLIANDGLHPSAKQYSAWLEAIKSPALQLLKRN